MDNLIPGLIGAAWLAIFVMLVWGVLSGWRRRLREEDAPLPVFRLLERDGLSLARLEDAFGVGELASAAARCASCAARTSCQAGVPGGWLGTRPAGCPNATLFERAHCLKVVAP